MPKLNEKASLVLEIKPVQRVVLLLAITVLVFIGIRHTLPPAARNNAGSSSFFSVERAFEYVKKIAQKPHPSGSAANAEVREYLVAELKKLGYQPQIQSAQTANPQKNFSGRIHNILVRAKGTQAGKALALVAHYDSVPAGPGAADNAASVAAVLEVLNLIKHRPVPRNDLICIFTDGEELGLLGAEAFVQQHSWVENIGLVLNFEYRGNRGKFLMFETNEGNGALIKGLASAVPFISANSMMYEVYRYLPNNTDFTAFKKAGIPGMNFAAIEGLGYYHTALDRPEFLSLDTLREEGDIMMSLVDYFGKRPLDNLAVENRVYFDFPGLGLLHYPVSWVYPLTACLVSAFALQLGIAGWRKKVRMSRVLAGLFAYFLLLIIMPAASQMAWILLSRVLPELNQTVESINYGYQYLAVFLFLNTGLFIVFQSYFCKRWVSIGEYGFGIIACWLIFLILSSLWLPGLSFLFLWPLAPFLFTLGLAYLNNRYRHFKVFLLFLTSVPAILIFIPLIKALFIALTIHKIGVIVLFLGLLLGVLILLIEVIAIPKRLIKPFT